MILSPAALGCTPSRRSDVGKPVLQSAMTMGESVELSFSAHAGIAALSDVKAELEPMPRGMTRST
jgi:hypothetical protein